MNDPLKLKQIDLFGFKSISSKGQSVDFDDITLFLGANGAGKSNFISFFEMLNHMMTLNLQGFVGQKGSADSLLYWGSQRTPRFQADIVFKSKQVEDVYSFTLSHATGNTLIFTEEKINIRRQNRQKFQKINLGAGHKETNLQNDIQKGGKTSQFVYNLLRRCQVFQFHDTSSTARIRNPGYVEDNRFLYSDGGNLAAFLFALKNRKESLPYYLRIVNHIRSIFPQFGDFELEPSVLNVDYIRLNWREKGESYLFGPHQLSDGTLRYMALATLLLQPKESLPNVIILDEPELGLHPAAISSLVGMMKIAARNAQVILATQSPRLVDEFEAKSIVIVERDEAVQSSVFKRLDETALAEWLQRYSLSELWEKNVLGGRP